MNIMLKRRIRKELDRLTDMIEYGNEVYKENKELIDFMAEFAARLAIIILMLR